ncbi:MAG: hypothetical protein U0T80_05480 [Flavobacteriaceae bacterium]
MIVSASIILGIVRLCLIVLLLFYFNQRIFGAKDKEQGLLDFIVQHLVKYGSYIVIIVFIEVQLRIYDFFNTLFFLLLVACFEIFGLKRLISPAKLVLATRKKSYTILRDLEEKKLGFSYFLPKFSKEKKINLIWEIVIITLLILITISGRLFFLSHDSYSLSNIWNSDITTVIDFDSQHWFENSISPIGELVIINFYGKITGLTSENALQSMGLIEAILIVLIIYWAISKVSKSKYIAPIIGSLCFALCFVILPVNIAYLQQHRSTFLALAIAIPLMVYYMDPKLLNFTRKRYFFFYLFSFVSIGLIDLFVQIAIVLPFMIIGLFVSKIKYKVHNLLLLLSYIVSTIILFLIYNTACINFGYDFMLFLHSSLVSISTYTYLPYLYMPYESLIYYYQIVSFVGLFLSIILIFIRKENINGAISFLLFLNFIIFVSTIQNPWIDQDLIRQTLAIFLSISVGVVVGLFFKPFEFLTNKIKIIMPMVCVLLAVGMTYTAYYYQKDSFKNMKRPDDTPREVLNAYDLITNEYFPYSYAVVNDYSAQALSKNKHFFVNYEDFLNDYLKRDEVFFKHIKDKKFLKNNPEYVLPNCVLVFVYTRQNKFSNELTSNKKYTNELIDLLKKLRHRGRRVRVFHEDKVFKIYEIVNIPGESRLTDLIF